MVETIDHLATNLADSRELYDMARADEDAASLESIEEIGRAHV